MSHKKNKNQSDILRTKKKLKKTSQKTTLKHAARKKSLRFYRLLDVCKSWFLTNSWTTFYSQIEVWDINSKFKTFQQEKFAKIFMIWQVICSCVRRTSSFVTSSKMSSKICMTECLQKPMIMLIKKHDSYPLFWHDLASFHYSAATLKWHEDNKVLLCRKRAIHLTPQISAPLSDTGFFAGVLARRLI